MENADKWFAIVNPVAGSGRGLADWPQISKLLRDNHIVPEYAFTERKYHAIELAVEAVNNGFRKLIVVGGDGTIHEAVNGLFIQKAVPTQDVLLSVIAVGTGNDWIRMFGIPRKYSEAIRAIVEGHSFLQDVGMISYYQSSYRQTRYMANVAGVGFDAAVNRRYNHLKEEGKRGKWLYLWSTLKAIMRYNSTGVKVYVDDQLVVNDLVYSATIGIGKYNGGGTLRSTPASTACRFPGQDSPVKGKPSFRAYTGKPLLFSSRVHSSNRPLFPPPRRQDRESVPRCRRSGNASPLCRPVRFRMSPNRPSHTRCKYP